MLWAAGFGLAPWSQPSSAPLIALIEGRAGGTGCITYISGFLNGFGSSPAIRATMGHPRLNHVGLVRTEHGSKIVETMSSILRVHKSSVCGRRGLCLEPWVHKVHKFARCRKDQESPSCAFEIQLSRPTTDFAIISRHPPQLP